MRRILCIALLGILPSMTAWGQEAGDIPGTGAAAANDDVNSLLDMDIQQLSQVSVKAPALDMQVSTVSRQESTVGKTPYAVFVITNEMIRRSGAKHLPDVLRMVPGLDVANIDGNKWAVSSRGFNGRWTDKLLVQIDGRTVYDPLFGGVYWDAQEVMLEDVERIEVIRGPGATVWGANAVNGVINILTKSSKDSQGTFVKTGAGTENIGFSSMRYGGKVNDDTTYRIYGKWFEDGKSYLPDNLAADDWRQVRTGFRIDNQADQDTLFTLQGDFYNGYSGDQAIWATDTYPFAQFVQEDVHIEGRNILGRMTRTLSEDSDWSLQLYYDETRRHYITSGQGQDVNTFDLDFQHRLALGDRQSLIWGFGYRHIYGEMMQSPPALVMNPTEDNFKIISYFAQDDITLQEDRWHLILGCKFEHNDFTNFEYQPTARLLCTPDEKHSLWGAVSRSVHVPTPSNEWITFTSPPAALQPLPIIPVLSPNSDLISTEMISYEVGIREQTTQKFSWDLAMYYNQYEHGMTTATGMPYFDPGKPAMIIPLKNVNGLSGEVYGAELATDFQAREDWKIRTAYTYTKLFLDGYAGETYAGTTPINQLYVQSSWNLGKNWEFDWITRYVDSLSTDAIPYYLVMDVRAAWKPTKHVEVALVGRNLLDWAHFEAGKVTTGNTLSTEVESSVYGQVTWRY